MMDDRDVPLLLTAEYQKFVMQQIVDEMMLVVMQIADAAEERANASRVQAICHDAAYRLQCSLAGVTP